MINWIQVINYSVTLPLRLLGSQIVNPEQSTGFLLSAIPIMTKSILHSPHFLWDLLPATLSNCGSCIGTSLQKLVLSSETGETVIVPVSGSSSFWNRGDPGHPCSRALRKSHWLWSCWTVPELCQPGNECEAVSASTSHSLCMHSITQGHWSGQKCQEDKERKWFFPSASGAASRAMSSTVLHTTGDPQNVDKGFTRWGRIGRKTRKHKRNAHQRKAREDWSGLQEESAAGASGGERKLCLNTLVSMGRN